MTYHKLAVWIISGAIVWVLLVLLVRFAGATDYRYCAQWSREYVKFLESRAYSYCLIKEVDKLSLPTNEDWVKLFLRLDVIDKGVEPATEDPTPNPKEADWKSQCKKDYRTYRSTDHTVVRYGSKGKRVPCPYQPT